MFDLFKVVRPCAHPCNSKVWKPPKYRNDLILSVSVVLRLKAVFSPLTPFSLQIHECPTRTRVVWWKCAAQRLKEETRDSLPSASSRCPFLSVFSPFAVPQVNTTISFYNGIRARPEDFNPDTWETNNYKVRFFCTKWRRVYIDGLQIFDPANMPMGTIDIPVWAQVTRSSSWECFLFSCLLFCLLCNITLPFLRQSWYKFPS